MNLYYKVKNFIIKNIIKTELKKAQIRGDFTSVSLLKYMAKKY